MVCISCVYGTQNWTKFCKKSPPNHDWLNTILETFSKHSDFLPDAENASISLRLVFKHVNEQDRFDVWRPFRSKEVLWFSGNGVLDCFHTRAKVCNLNYLSNCAIWMIIRMTVFWTVCTQNYIAMCNLKCSIQMMVRTVIWIAQFKSRIAM